jgi:nucleoid DNA-binding protein
MAKYTPKTQKNNSNVDDFLATVEDLQKRTDSKRLVKIFEDMTKEKAVMWGTSIVGFGTYHYKYASGQEGDWMKTGFSPRKQNLTLYIMSGFDDYAKNSGYNPKPYLNKLGPHSTGKACLYIKRLSDIDINVLKNIIKKSYASMSAK